MNNITERIDDPESVVNDENVNNIEGIDNKTLTDLTKMYPNVPKQDMVEISRTILQTSIHSGPLPSPESFNNYEITLPGAADRILKMAEIQQGYRFDLMKEENKILLNHQNLIDNEQSNGYRSTMTATVGAFLLMGIALIGGFILINNDKGIAGLVSLVATFGIAMGTIIYGHKKGKDAKKESAIKEDKSISSDIINNDN